MRYRYARDQQGEIVDALTLDPTRWARGTPLSCVGCDKDVVPVLGVLRERHFRHIRASQRPCSRETYLHRLAKQFVAESFRAALLGGRPYRLTLEVPQECRHWEKAFGFVCQNRPARRSYDLTRYFDEVCVEAGVEGFVADVLLNSRKTGQKLLIEIAVSHQCTPDKIASGLRILELRIGDESCLGSMLTGLDPAVLDFTCHNFKPPEPLQTSCKGQCDREISAFLVFESGKSRIETGTAGHISRRLRARKVVYSHIIDEVEHGIVTPYLAGGGYRAEARKALLAGAPIKCCGLCRYAGFKTIDRPVFCKVRRLEVGLNEAATCSIYRLDSYQNVHNTRPPTTRKCTSGGELSDYQ